MNLSLILLLAFRCFLKLIRFSVQYLAFVMVGCHRYFMRKSNIVHYYNINAGRHVFEFYGKLSFGHFFGGAHETVNILISINRTTAIIIPRIHSKVRRYYSTYRAKVHVTTLVIFAQICLYSLCIFAMHS